MSEQMPDETIAVLAAGDVTETTALLWQTPCHELAGELALFAREVQANRARRCDGCAFWLLEPDIDDHLCHRDAPGMRWASPADFFCAAFQPKGAR